MMAWTLRGCLWYLRGAICRRLGPNRSLASILLLLVICLFILSSFQTTVFEGHGELSSGMLEMMIGTSSENLDTEIAEEKVTGDYTDVEEPSGPPVRKNAPFPNAQTHKKIKRRGFGIKGKMKNKKKRPNLPFPAKKDDISKRKDKLMFKRTDLNRPSKNNNLLPNRHKASPKIYQDDAIVGEEIEWSLETEQERRRDLRKRSLLVKRECGKDTRGKLNRRLGMIYEHLNWVTRYNLIWCPIFKAGSTTWMKNLLLLAGETSFNGSIHNRASQLYRMPASRQRQDGQLEKSLKFMIVRHPFDRLLSAYRDKMLRTLKTTDPYRRLQLDVLKNYSIPENKGNATVMTTEEHMNEDNANKTMENGKNHSDTISPGDTDHPTFLQFLYKVRDDMKFFWKVNDGTLVDAHWTPYWYTCAPCQIHYDVIAKVETLDLDQEFLIRAANLQGVLVNARTHASNFDGYTDTESASAQYFSQIPVELLKELEQLYWPDFKLFGYTAENYLKMAKTSV